MKDRYTLIIDGRVACTGNHIPYLKKEANFEFEFLNAFFAQILVGKKQYTARFYNTDWH